MRTLKLFGLLAFILAGCRDDLQPLPDNPVGFEISELTVPDSISETDIRLKLRRSAEADSKIILDISTSGLTFGQDFTTLPEAVKNRISLSVPAGSTEATLRLRKLPGLELTGNQSLNFTLQTATAPVIPGRSQRLTIKFTMDETSDEGL